MQPLDLHVKQRIRTDDHPQLVLRHLGQHHLVVTLDRVESVSETRIIRKPIQLDQFRRVLQPSIPNRLLDQRRKLRIANIQPPPESHPVGQVQEPVRKQLEELRKQPFTKQPRMQRRHSVRRMPTQNRHVRHPHMLATLLPNER